MHSTAAPARSVPDVLALLSDDRQAVSRRMRQLLELRGDGVYALAAYHLGWRDERGLPCEAGHGKLLRPALLLLGYELGDRFPKLESYLTPILLVIVLVSVLPVILELRKAARD